MGSSLNIWTIGDRMTASTRLRIHQYLPLLERDGLRPQVRTIPRGYVQRLWLKGTLPRGSTLLIQKKLFATHEIARLRTRTSRLVFDVDDAIYHDGPGSTANYDRFRAVTAASDRILAGNATLAGACADPSRARILPTPVDIERLRPTPKSRRDPALVAWIGSRTTLENLPLVFEAFTAVAAGLPRARLVIMADRVPPGLPHRAEFQAWSPEAERALLGAASVGVMPLVDNVFNRGKCGFKILLYQAAGLAVIASPVGVNRELVEPAHTGFLPRTPAEWREALQETLEDPDLAYRMGEAGRAAVERSHAIPVLYPEFRDALAGIP